MIDVSVLSANPKFASTGGRIIKKNPRIWTGGNSTGLFTNPLTASPFLFTASLPKQKLSRAKSRQLRRLEVKPPDEDVKACIKDDQLLLACGKKIPLLSNACVEPSTGVRSKMPVVKGRVGEKPVDDLGDTGCSGIVVKKDLVSEDHFTGDFNVMLLIDSTARKVPIAKIDVDTPYLKGQVKAQCLLDPIYDLVIGNVPGARAAHDPDASWQDHV